MAMVLDDSGPFGSGVRAQVGLEPCDTNGDGDGTHSQGRSTPAAKDAVRKSLRDVISRESMSGVQKLVREIENLSKLERLLLYLELPSSLSGIPDPLRQPLNPLGSRYEIQLTITWIKTHLEEDPQVSLPKHEVYDDYIEYCNHNGLKPLSTADFGKVMKQVYPQVRPRRLGTRGNSRYCYAGLKKKLKLEDPFTPEVGGEKQIKIPNDHEEELGSASSFLIREWVEKLLGVKFDSLRDLALYLIDKMYVDNRSPAAHTVLSVMSKTEVKTEPVGRLVNGTSASHDGLQEHKRKVERPVSPESSPKHQQQQQQHSTLVKRTKLAGRPVEPSFVDRMHKSMDLSPDHVTLDSGQLRWDSNLLKNPDSMPDFQSVDDYVCGPPSAGSDFPQFESLHTGGNRTYLNHDVQVKDEWDAPPPPPPPPPPPTAVTSESNRSSQMEHWEMDRKDNTIDDELVTYFKDSSNENDENQSLKLSQLRQLLVKNLKSPTSAFKPKQSTWSAYENETSSGGRETDSSNTSANASLSSRRRVSFNPLIVQDTGGVIVTSSGSIHGNGNHGGSLLPSIISGGAPGGPTLSGQSPGTRKRHFSFQPISDRQGSCPQSPSASPFISPRSTPVPMMRSRHSSGSALPLHLLPGGLPKGAGPGVLGLGGIIFNSSSSDISRAATFGSASECSTPFISPHGTPIPFNRSRHNSAQGRLCRSRHSSGLGGPYRYNPAFSPMALNNLNNPYSPQPATPVGNHLDQDMFSAAMAQAYGSDPNNGSGMGDNCGSMDPNRSRHSSAGSCHDTNGLHVQSAPISPHCGGGGLDSMDMGGYDGGNDMVRHRHASAGNLPPTGSMSNVKPTDWIGVNDAVLTSDSQIVVGDGSGGYVTSSFGSDLGFHPPPVVSGTKKDLSDDLDMALSALKDCDNDFSKFVQEVENDGK